MKILVIDNEQQAVNMLKSTLMRVCPEAKVICSTDSADALELIESGELLPDAVFCAVLMRKVKGITFAERIKKINPYVNIVFAADCPDYMHDAIKLHASGYLLKPFSDKEVRAEIDNFLYPVRNVQKGIFMHTFGNFDMFVDGKLWKFRSQRAKELLAVLVDKKGMSATKKEICALLFEDKPYTRQQQDYFAHIYSELIRTLREAGGENIIIRSRNCYALDCGKFSCDAYDYEAKLPYALDTFKGEYMSQYSWADGRFK